MAFQRKRKVYKLDFGGTEYDGLEVRIRGLTTGEFLELVTLSGATTETSGETEKLLKLMSTHLVSWNLQDEDEPVPTTLEGISSNDLSMNMRIIDAWTDSMSSVPASVEKKSPSGDLALVASIPTETL